MLVPAACILVGIVLIVASLVGLGEFLKSDYFTDPGPYAPNSWQGYTLRTFIGLVFFTCSPTAGFTFLLVGARALALQRHQLWSGTIYAAVGLTSAAVGSAGLVWGRESLKCLAVFCLDTTRYVEVPNARPEAGIGWMSVVGMSAFIALVPLGLITTAHAFKASIPQYHPIRGSSWSDAGTRPRGATVHPIVLIVLLAVVFFMGFISLYLPNSWEYFVAARIASKAVAKASTDPNVCNTMWQIYSCPELPFAWFTTKNVELSSVLTLKMFPANIFFYVYLLALIAITALLRVQARGRVLMARHFVRIARVNVSIGEAAFSAATALMVAAFFFYWAHDHNYNGYWTGGVDLGVLPSERFARALGQLAVMFMSLLMFPASRWSVMHSIFGTSWEGSLWMHRVLGRLFAAAAVAHMIAWYVMYHQVGQFPQDIIDVPMHLPSSIDNFTVPLNTIALWGSLVCLVLTLEPIRRRTFEVFYYSHMAMVYVLIPAVLWHAAAGWEYLLPGMTVWFLDRCVRMWRSGFAAPIESSSVIDGIIRISFARPGMQVHPGQYVFVNIPEVSVLEWHPFTISASTTMMQYALHIRTMGPNSWTQRLAQRLQKQEAFTLAVDGPYGRPFDPAGYTNIILVAGGIGITPCASIFGSLRTYKLSSDSTVTLMWSVREPSLVESISPQLRDPPEGCQTILFCTSTGCRIKPEPYYTVRNRRISPREDFRDAVSPSVAPSNVLVFVCGPEDLVATVGDAALAAGYAFHRETFLL